MYWRLQQAAGATLLSPLGITFAEFLNSDESSNRKSFLLSLDMEKVSHAGFTGEDMGGGRQLLIDVKRCGDNVDHPDRVHVLLKRLDTELKKHAGKVGCAESGYT